MTRPRLKNSESQKRDWAKDVDTETPLRLLVGLDFFLFDAVKSKFSLINQLMLIQFI